MSSISYQIVRYAGELVVRLLYSTRRGEGEAIESDYRVGVVWTRPHYGGRRWWWICPGCGRRVGKLYTPPQAVRFACRHCYDLTYTSCQDSHKDDWCWKMLARDRGVHWKGIRDLMKQRGLV